MAFIVTTYNAVGPETAQTRDRVERSLSLLDRHHNITT